jgi:hypothetical protein
VPATMRLVANPVLIGGHGAACAKPFGQHRHRSRVKHHVVLAESHAAHGATAAVAELRLPGERYGKQWDACNLSERE